MRWKRFSVSVLLVFLLAAGVPGLIAGITDAPLAQAQGGGQPVDTVALFEPFWQAWDLLHEEYVDPLDDNALVQGAMKGLITAVDDPDYALVTPLLAENPSTRDERFAPFWELWTLLHDTYAALDDAALLDGALYGMFDSLGDPHSGYMDPEVYARITAGMSAEYEGIGASVQLNEEAGGLELVSIMPESPAEQAGLRAGDTIVEVGGDDITALTQQEIIAQVRGPAGTTVVLGILRAGEPAILQIEVTRARISVPTVESEVLDGNIGYIHLYQFEFSTGEDMRIALEAMDANHLNGLILDVRGNPGGYLSTAIDVASAYLDEGLVLIERTPDSKKEHPVLGNAVAPDVPMVVLVDQGSASASELIAGALQDNGRATVVGMPTFGKGSVQTWHTLSNGGGVRITISRWYTPDGTSVTETGIHPDVEIAYEPLEVSGEEDNQLTAALAVLQGTYQPQPVAGSVS